MWHDKNQIKEIEYQVFLAWKQLGKTPLERLEEIRVQLGISDDVPMTYAGRLDPAAEGELLVLVGDVCKRKGEFLGLDKTYQFKILVGFETDTLDLLGILTNNQQDIDNYDIFKNIKINEITDNLIGQHAWPYPAYSARPVNGRPLWQWARQGRYDELVQQAKVPVNEFEIKQLDYVGQEIMVKDDVCRYIDGLADAVIGDFRQQQIIDTWKETLKKQGRESFQLLEFETTVSSGAYVRQIAEKIGKILHCSVVTFSIIRTKIHL